jgi:hypothetical protein
VKVTLALGLTLVSIAAAAVTAGQAFATTQGHAAAPKTLRIVMRDPGCHWFSVGGKFSLTATVAGSTRLVNYDEAALKVTGHGVTKRIPVGKQLVVGHGRYVITMVGQASDDNHLRLTVK